jgi:hypothetical protein
LIPQTLLRYPRPINTNDGRAYEARACGSEGRGGIWEAWIEFVPVDGGKPVRSPRETTQPNLVDTEYWATGLTDVFLEGALQRALNPLTPTPGSPLPPPHFDGPANSARPAGGDEPPSSVLDPFSVYTKGEPVLRKQLAALSAWHLVNIILAYELADDNRAALSWLPAPALIEKIVTGVQAEVTRTSVPKRARRRT